MNPNLAGFFFLLFNFGFSTPLWVAVVHRRSWPYDRNQRVWSRAAAREMSNVGTLPHSSLPHRAGPDYEIYVMNAYGTGVRRCTQSRGRNTSPKWSPDGKRISFDHASQGECDIFVIDAPQK